MNEEIITEFTVGERLDKVLSEHFSNYSRSALAKLIEYEAVLVNQEIKQSRYKVKHGDKIVVDLSRLTAEPDEIDIPVLYEDDDVVVLNKPTGILTHSKGGFNKEGTVATFIQPKLQGDIEWKQSNRAGIVHRLDRGTSGIIICAKNKLAQDYLQGQFSKRNVKKTYIALIKGELAEDEGLIDVPIERNPKKPATFRAGINGKPAQTHFRVLTKGTGYSLVELKPITGRTHQLRVHLDYLKHPIVGDEFYNGESSSRLLLHAISLEITLPSRERKVFTAPLPTIFSESVSL